MSEQYPAARPEPTADARRYRGRPCFICGSPYRCRHREPQVERAEWWMPPVDLADLARVVLAIAKEQKA